MRSAAAAGKKMNRYYRQDRYLQHGNGLGSFLAGVVRKIVPWLSRTAPKVMKVASKAAQSKTGQQLIKTAKKAGKQAALEATASALKGEPKKGAKKAIQDASRKLAKTLEESAAASAAANGNGKKKKKKNGGLKRGGTAAAPTVAPAKKARLKKTLGPNSLV